MASTWHFPREDICATPLKVGEGGLKEGLKGEGEGREMGEEEQVHGSEHG